MQCVSSFNLRVSVQRRRSPRRTPRPNETSVSSPRVHFGDNELEGAQGPHESSDSVSRYDNVFDLPSHSSARAHEVDGAPHEGQQNAEGAQADDPIVISSGSDEHSQDEYEGGVDKDGD